MKSAIVTEYSNTSTIAILEKFKHSAKQSH